MRILGSRYRRLATLAERGGCLTFTAQDRLLGRTCVLKVAASGSRDATDLYDESERLRDLCHPGLLPLADRFSDAEGLEGMGRVSGFATPWVEGAHFGSSQLDRPLEERLEAFGELVETVAYLHRSDMLHLDIKPANVLASPRGVMLLDLGTARPLVAGPGQAGGTLGYAAPEVLAGDAASVQSDIFSLGALLYEVITGNSPFGPLSPTELRRAALAGDMVPVGAWGVRIPAALARLVDSMLMHQPRDRPADLVAIRESLGKLGVPVPPPRGEPRWTDRSALMKLLTRRLGDPGVVALVGPDGSGRTRVARRLLTSARWSSLDLTGVEQPRDVIGKLAASLGAEVPFDVDDPVWRTVVISTLSNRCPVDLVCLGPRSAYEVTEQPLMDALAGALARGGARVLWLAEDDTPGAVTVSVGPLRGDEAAEVAHWFGIPAGSTFEAAMRRTGGWAGRLVRALTPAPPIPASLPEDAGRSLALLAGLPEGVPPPVVERLPADVTASLPTLEKAGLIRTGADGTLFVVHLERELPDDAAQRAWLHGVLDDLSDQLQPLWRSLLYARLGDLERAREDLPDHLDLPVEKKQEARELYERLVPTGDMEATGALLDLCIREGDDKVVLELVDGMDDPSADLLLFRAIALRRLHRIDEAVEQVEDLIARGNAPARLWSEQCLLAIKKRDPDLADRAIAGLIEAQGELTMQARNLQVEVTLLRMSRGETPEGIDELVDWAVRNDDLPDFGPALMARLGECAAKMGRTAVGLRLMQSAAQRADHLGALLPAAGIRMNRALVLERVGRMSEARRALSEALLIATRARNESLHIQILYNLARLELRSGRLPSAEVRLLEFEQLTRSHDHPEIRVRGALNRAWYHLLRGEAEVALDLLEAAPSEEIRDDAYVQLRHLTAWALLDLGRPEEVLEVLDDAGELPGDIAFVPIAISLRGRAHLALGRKHLAEAREMVPRDPEPGMELTAGEVLLAWGGEDADPAMFPDRRDALERAARYLRGPMAGQAARLRERMLDGPGAALHEIVALTEAMHDPQAFPEALARLVRESLGAHRVLIMLRLPGLGNQLGYTELSGAQAAGIGREVLERIRSPEDVWISGDAFADPHLRESSQTVQTFELKSLLAVAIPRGDEAVGALYVDDMYRANRFNDEDIALLQRLARAVGGMIPLMRREGRSELDEPGEVLGVLLNDRNRLRELSSSIEMMRGAPESNVLITGPTGSGKSVLARRLATEVLGLTGVEVVVLRKGDPQMLVTQLFGSRRGEFTGATDRQGALDRCRKEGKALFLDEIQNLDETGQQILLPLLDLPRSFGGLTGTAKRLDFPLHVVLGTNHDVRNDRAFEVFRSDLWYRMSRLHLDLPPLAERGAEVVYRYLAGMLEQREVPAPEQVFKTSALYQVTHAVWPGNLRELDAFAERAAHLYLRHGRPLGSDDLAGLRVSTGMRQAGEQSAPGEKVASLDDAMIRHVMAVLRRHEWVQKYAAAELSMNAPTLNKLLKRHGLLEEVRRRRRMAN